MKYLHLYKTIAPKNPEKPHELAGIKWHSLDTWTFCLAMAVVLPLAIWAVWAILSK